MSVFAEKNRGTYELILRFTEIRIGDIVREGCDGTVQECRDTQDKQIDRDIVGTICIRLVLIQIDSP